MSVESAINYVISKTEQFINNGNGVGAGVVISNSNNIVFARGFGLSVIGDNNHATTKYDLDTIILTASVSKVISGTMLAYYQNIIGKENVDKSANINNTTNMPPTNNQKVLNAKANIKTSMPYITEEMLVKDLISHRSGIGEQYGTISEQLGFDRSHIINSIQYTPNSNFRNEYQYTNLPFTQGVKVGLKSIGLNFTDGYQEIFKICGMDNSSINFVQDKYKGYADLLYAGNPPVTNSANRWYPIFSYNVQEQLSAGGIYTTLNDMGNFINFHLKNSLRSLSERQLCSDFYNGIIVENSGSVYGPGVIGSNIELNGKLYRSQSHSGFLPNTRTFIRWIYGLDLGIFIHTNTSPNAFPEALARAFFSIITGSSIVEADIIFNETTKVFMPSFISMTDKITFETTCNDPNINTDIIGLYKNYQWGKLQICQCGSIRIGKLSPAKLFKCTNNKYQFIFVDISEISNLGTVDILDKNKLRLSIYDKSMIFERAC